TALLGPRALAGTFDPAVLEMTDADGISLRTALHSFGLAPDEIAALRRDSDSILGYLETHIEQGPVLEQANEALGVVTAICGIERHPILLTGETGHAGTVPMALRRDALVGASAIVTEVNRLARQDDDLLGTVGYLKVAPNAVNAIAREVRMTIELRSPDDGVREAAGQGLSAFARAVAQDHGLACQISRDYHQPAQPCDAGLTDTLESAVRRVGGRGLRLPSGATHDASAMADLCPIAMLFVRCRGVVSHIPEEFADQDDMAKAVNVICEFLKLKGDR
ncbi:MAG TPA: Zn-dependent hydrolase, partial [Rhodobacterales bacterium]|nr:Zn-dependent hydrolase [Rhodobacterales bacterium]